VAAFAILVRPILAKTLNFARGGCMALFAIANNIRVGLVVKRHPFFHGDYVSSERRTRKRNKCKHDNDFFHDTLLHKFFCLVL
jgi:hypothetical protein